MGCLFKGGGESSSLMRGSLGSKKSFTYEGQNLKYKREFLIGLMIGVNEKPNQ